MTKIRDRIKRAARHIPRLPRKWRVVRNLACAVLLAAVFIVPQFNLYPLTLDGAFRRECKTNLLGEPEIIWQSSGGSSKEFLVADDGEQYYYGVFENLGVRGWTGAMIPWEKEDGLTFMPFEIFCDSGRDIALRLLLLHDVEGARYAQIDIPLEWETHYGYDGEEAYAEINETYTVGLSQSVNGIMHGILLPRVPFSTDPRLDIGGAAMRSAEVTAIERLTWGGHEVPITVRLYGSGGTLLREETLTYSFPQ